MYRNGIKNLYNNKNNNFIENIIFPSSKTFSIFLLLLIINNNISSTGTVIAEATTINIQSDTNKAYRPEVSRGLTPKEKIAYESVVTCIRVKYKGDAQETFEKYDNNKTGIAKNRARKDGIKTKEIGIKILSSESNVSEIDIQYKLHKK